MYAVIKTGGKQYRVAAGDIVKIEKIIGDHKVGDKIEIPEGTVIADVLNTYKIQLNFKAP